MGQNTKTTGAKRSVFADVGLPGSVVPLPQLRLDLLRSSQGWWRLTRWAKVLHNHLRAARKRPPFRRGRRQTDVENEVPRLGRAVFLGAPSSFLFLVVRPGAPSGV